jgi:predicted RecA/RadA family phage recombinase
MIVLNNIKAVSADVLRVEHRNSEPFDHPVDPAGLATIAFNVGQVVAVNSTGYAVRGDKANIATEEYIGLFMLPRDPESALKNDYVEASGNASIFSNGIVVLNTQISDATVAAGAKLYVGTAGQITTLATASVQIGVALTARTVAGADVRVKLGL